METEHTMTVDDFIKILNAAFPNATFKKRFVYAKDGISSKNDPIFVAIQATHIQDNQVKCFETMFPCVGYGSVLQFTVESLCSTIRQIEYRMH